MIAQVSERPGGLELLEPDFDAIPIRWRRGLNNTVRHLTLQRSVCEALGCEPVFPSILQAGVCSPGFFASEAFTMSRDQRKDSDSGWVFAADGYQGSEGGFGSLYQIAMQRISVIPFLALPPTATVCIRHGRIEARYGDVVVSSDDNDLLRDWAARFSANFRRYFYIECPPNSTLVTIMTGITDAFINTGGDYGLLEARATITLPDGVVLFGVSFKTEHAGVDLAIQRFCTQKLLTYGELTGTVLHLGNGESLSLASCVAAKY